MEKICPKNKDGAPNKHFAFLTMISYNETIYGAFENCKVISDISKISRLKFGFTKNRSFRLKRAALFLGEKEPPAILVGFPHML